MNNEFNNYDFEKMSDKSIIEFVQFFEKTNILNIQKNSDIINILKNTLSLRIDNDFNVLFFPICKMQFGLKKFETYGLRTEIYYYCIELFLLFTTDHIYINDYYSDILLIELSKIYLIFLNKIINQIDLLGENSEDCRIGLLNDFDSIREFICKKIILFN